MWRKGQMKQRAKNIITIVILALITIAAIAGVILSLSEQTYLREHGLITNARVTNLRQTHQARSLRTTTRVYVSYEVEGLIFLNRHLNINPRNTYFGEIIPIYHSADNPNCITVVDRQRSTDIPWRLVFVLVVWPGYLAILWLLNRKQGLENSSAKDSKKCVEGRATSGNRISKMYNFTYGRGELTTLYVIMVFILWAAVVVGAVVFFDLDPPDTQWVIAVLVILAISPPIAVIALMKPKIIFPQGAAAIYGDRVELRLGKRDRTIYYRDIHRIRHTQYGWIVSVKNQPSIYFKEVLSVRHTKQNEELEKFIGDLEKRAALTQF